MKFHFYLIFTCLFLGACQEKKPAVDGASHEKIHSIRDELLAFCDFTSLPAYLSNTICEQVSSYDTTGGNDDGFSGKYSFLKRNADSSLVIFDRTGSGVINRIWTPTPTSDTLDFFIDDTLQPAFSIRYDDLFSGNNYPFIAPLCGNQLGGFYCYLPIPFKTRCRIVSRGKKMQFHQIQCRMYERGAEVKSFKLSLTGDEKIVLDKIVSLWNNNRRSVHDFYGSEISESITRVKIKPGETEPVLKFHHGGRILGIEIEPAEGFEGPEKNIDIKITWDGEKNPAVDCPVADFFGYGFGKRSMQSLLLGSHDNINYCYFPMPFDKQAEIELIYRENGQSVLPVKDISVRVWYTAEKRVAEKEGKFYTRWNSNEKLPKGQSHVFLDIKGKGHYVGTILQAQGLKAGMTYFFEGDDSASIDGNFRIHGTGSEDYFNGGWYAMLDRWDGKKSLPAHGALEYSLPFCRTGGYRFYFSDKLSFEKSFFMGIEHGPTGNGFPAGYTSLAIYYSDRIITEFIKPVPELTQVFMPDTFILYPQLLNYNIYGNLDVKTTWKYGTGGESYLFTPRGDSWLRISLADLPYKKYSLYLDLMKEPQGCDISVWQRQTRISEWITTSRSTEERAKELYICDVITGEFDNSLTFRFRTDVRKNSFLLNRVILIRRPD